MAPHEVIVETGTTGMDRSFVTCLESVPSTGSRSLCSGTRVTTHGLTSTPYARRAASIGFDGELIAGGLPRRALLLVGEWAQLHRDELTENWERARRDEPLRDIEPLP